MILTASTWLLCGPVEDLSTDPLFFCLLHLFFSSFFYYVFHNNKKNSLQNLTYYLFSSLSFTFPEAGLTAALAVCVVSMFSALKALPWHMTAKHYCFCRVHWHLYILNNVCENEMMRYMQWREYRWVEGRSYLSAIRHDRLISEILNCKRRSHSSWDESHSFDSFCCVNKSNIVLQKCSPARAILK